MRASHPQTAGFTLPELILVIIVLAIVIGVAGVFVTRPMEGYLAQSRRSELVDLASNALTRMTREIRMAMPNTVRVSGGGRCDTDTAGVCAIELLNAADGGRYRVGPGNNPGGANHSNPEDRLDLCSPDCSPDASFNITGRFDNLAFTYGTPIDPSPRIAVDWRCRAQIYADAGANNNRGIVTPAATIITLRDDTDEDQIDMDTAHEFELCPTSGRPSGFQVGRADPPQRLFLIDTPVTFLCDADQASLARFSDYTIAGAQPTDPGTTPLSNAQRDLLVERVARCVLNYDASDGTAIVTLTLSRGGERVALMQQAHVVN